MRAKKLVYFLSVLLLFSAFMGSVGALPETTVTFSGGGVTIGLIYPEEAYPNSNITHYVTITSTTAVTLKSFTVVIKALVNSSWQEILNGMNVYQIPPQLPQSYNLTLPLPQDANGMLQCFIWVNTSSIDDLSTTVYTTLVSDPTFSEIQSMYDELWENYTSLNANWTALNENYTNLREDYDILLEQNATLSEALKNSIADYESLLNDYNRRLEEYNALNSKYETLDSSYRSKLSELSALQTDYNDLNSTHYSLLADYEALQALYDELNQTYNDLLNDLNSLQGRISDSEIALNNDRIVMFIFIIALVALIAFIVYLKRGKEEPYVVIRKETVSMNQDENT